jgi:hypothetical protein
VTEIATPTPELARVSSASMPAMPAKNATVMVSHPTVLRPFRSVFSTEKSSGSTPSASCSAVDTAAASPAAVIPAPRVPSARPSSRASRVTTATPAAVIGSRSGLNAIAPTTRIAPESSTP